MAEGFLKVMQRLVAVSAIPASALRNQGPSGMVASARDFLTAFDWYSEQVDSASRGRGEAWGTNDGRH
ncbi:hypothetical protein BH09GEM1_BH09GEM1_24920 [soil metagenome]